MDKFKNLKFAISEVTTWNGKQSQEFFSSLLENFHTKNFMTLYPGVKDRIKVPKLTVGSIMIADGCTYTDNGTQLITEKQIECCSLVLYTEVCLNTLESGLVSEQYKAGANTDEIVPEMFQNYMVNELAKYAARDLEQITWVGGYTASPLGATGAALLCDGILVEMDADNTVIPVTATTASIDATNALDEVRRVIDAMPDNVYSNYITTNQVSDITLHVPISWGKAIRAALAKIGGNNWKEAYMDSKGAVMLYEGIQINESWALPAKNAVLITKQNFLGATDLSSDLDVTFTSVNLKTSIGQPRMVFTARIKYKATYFNGDEIVWYKP